MTEVRQALQALRRRPGYALACVATLALVLGANTALFATLSATLFRPIPLRSGDRIVQVFTQPPGATQEQTHALHEAELLHFRERSTTLGDFASYTVGERILARDEPRVVRVASVTPSFLEMAVDPPVVGRILQDDDDRDRRAVAVLAYGLWSTSFGADPGVVGRTVVLNEEPYEVVGVMSPGFPPHFLEADLWVPLGIGSPPEDGGIGRANLGTLARLAAGSDVGAAHREVSALMGEVVVVHPDALRGWTAGVRTVRAWRYGALRSPLFVLMAAMVLLVVLGCVNVGGLTLAQVTARESELGLRRALGATRGRVMRLVLVEIGLLNVAGAVVGIALAHLLLPVLLRIDPAATEALGPVGIDWRVAVFSLLAALGATTVASLAPILQAVGPAAVGSGPTARTHGSRARERWRAGMAVAQAAICVVLLINGGLLLAALQRSAAIDPGFEATGIVTTQIRMTPRRYPTHPQREQLLAELETRLGALPGVTGVGAVVNDFIPGAQWISMIELPDHPTPDETPHRVQLRRASASYFGVMGIARVSGRIFEPSDVQDGVRVTVVSRAFANQLLPGIDPLGQRIDRSGTVWTIVGVVDDARDFDVVVEPEPTMYIPWSQSSTAGPPLALMLRTSAGFRAVAQPIRETIRALDPTLVVDVVRPLTEFVDDSLAPQRFRGVLLSLLGAVGVILGAIGIAGLTAQTFEERRTELGVRLALGAERLPLLGRAVGRQVVYGAAGVVIGASGATLASRALAALLADLDAFDPGVTVAAVMLTLVVVAGAATVAARRVLHLEPREALAG